MRYVLDNDTRIFYYAASLIYALPPSGAKRSLLNGTQ